MHKITEYKIPTIKADGKEYVIPQIGLGDNDVYGWRALFMPVGSSVTGTCKITISNVQGGQRGAIGVYKNGGISGTAIVGSILINTLCGEFDLTGVNTLLFKSPKATTDFNLTIKIESVGA